MKFSLKKIFKSVFCFALATNILGTANAEQPAAEQYRQMFKSGNFYLEYRMFSKLGKYDQNSANIILAGKNGQRILKQTAAKMSGFLGKSYFASNELAGEYNNSSGRLGYGMELFKKKDFPDILYRDGKYYRFNTFQSFKGFGFTGRISKEVNAIVLPESQLNSPALDPIEEWQFVKSDLALPDEFAIFFWNDPMRENFSNAPAPRYTGSGKRKVKDKEYDCDQYINEIKNLTGKRLALELYNMLYENGKLVMIQKYLVQNRDGTLSRTTEIKNITSEVPDSVFEIKKKIKVYAAQNGDMADMLEQQTVVETLGGK